MIAGLLVIVFLVGVAIYKILLSQSFRVVSTTPDVDNVAAVSPFLKINFNRQLSTKGLSISSSYSIVTSYSVQGKTLVVNLQSPMTVGYNYDVKIKTVSDIDGNKIINKTFAFTPKDIPWEKLSPEQQSALLQTQANRPRTKNDINFINLDALTDYGITSDQINNLKEDFFGFMPKATTITVDRNSVVIAPHDRNSASTSSTGRFNVKADSEAYNASVDYSYASSYIRLYLYNAQGSQVFDSGAIIQTGE